MTIQDVFEAVGARAAGRMTDEEVHALESVACPGAGACGGQFTANTMALVIDFLGISPRGLSGIPATHRVEGRRRPARPGELVMKLVRDDIAPVADPHARGVRERDRRRRRRRAARPTASCTCSRSPARSGVPLELEDFDRIAERDADRRRPEAGRPLRRDRPVRGRRRRPRRPRARRAPASPTAGARGVDGRTLGEVGARRRRASRAGRRRLVARAAEADRRPRDPARLARARGLRRQARRPRAALPSRPGARVRLRGGVLRRRQGAHDRARRGDRDPLRGPRRRPGHARDAARHRGARRRGSRRRGRADHRRPLLRRHPRPDGRPHRAGGRPRRPARGRCATATRSSLDVEQRRLDLEIPAAELAERLAAWTQPAPRYTRGVFAKYAATVGSASEGATT